MTSTTMANAMADGISFLDGAQPGWENEINLDRLEMSNGTHCVLGQLAHGQGWIHALNHFGLDHDTAAQYGLASGRWVWDYTALTDAWRDVIERRRGVKMRHLTEDEFALVLEYRRKTTRVAEINGRMDELQAELDTLAEELDSLRA